MKTITFQQWLNRINESLTSPVKHEPEVNTDAVGNSSTSQSSSRQDIMSNVNDIITSLENLSKELTEELAKTDEEMFSSIDITEDIENELSEAGDPGMIAQIIGSIKAVSAQKKVNKAKVNKVALEIAKDDAPNDEQRKALQAKEEIVQQKIDNLQDAIDNRFKNSGEFVQKRLANAKIKGEMEVLKQHAGNDITSKKNANIKQRMSNLQKKYQDNQAAIKELEPSEEDKKKAKEKMEENKKNTVKESLVIRANAIGNSKLAEEINSKQDWQLENNSVLYMNYESKISKIENDYKLNEVKHLSTNVKSKFGKLMS